VKIVTPWTDGQQGLLSTLRIFVLAGAFLIAMPETVWAETVRLRVSNMAAPNATEPKAVADLRIQQEFLRRHPSVELVRAEGIRLEGSVSEVATVMMVVGGIAPDVISMNFRSTDSFVRKGIVGPLDGLFDAETPEARAGILARIPPQIEPVVNRVGPDGERRLYGLPGNMLFSGIYFNRELFQNAGLPPRAPRTWEELLDFCRKLKAANPSTNPLYLGAGSAASWNLMSFLWSAGGEAVVESAPDEWRAAFDTPEAVKAYEIYYRLVEGERLVRRGGAIATQQEMEKTGMIFGYVGNALNMDPELFGFGTVPKGPTGLRGAEINASVFGLYSGIKDSAVRQAAWEYIQFLASEDAERIRTETMIGLGLANQVNPVMLRKFGFDQYLALMPPGLEDEFAEAFRTGKPEPFGRNCNLVYSEMTYPLDQILISETMARLWKAGDGEGMRREIERILKTAVQRTNERMLGYVPPAEMNMRRTVAVVVVIAIAVGFFFVGWSMFRVFSEAGRMTAQPVSSRGILPWLFLAPALLLIFVWKYIPLVRGTGLAFLDYQIVLPSTFVGLDNFANVLFDPSFWNSLLATLHYAVWTLTVGFAAPILLAYALHVIPRHKLVFRLLFYLPAIISATAVFFLWRELFGAESVLNQMLRFFGFEARRAWNDDPYLAMLSCILPGIWAGVGPGCLIYLAALKTIPVEQFEAAEIDGASFLQRTRLIVYPGLKALILINFTGAVAASFHGATNILIMTGGGPNGATEVTSLLIFFEAFTRLRLGHATAMAWILGSLLVGITVLQLQKLSQLEFKTAK
jgi:ABC-type sugar transport system permease subunit